jgi:glucokinase
MTDTVIGVDVGGTSTAVGAVSLEGEVLVEASAPTHRDGSSTARRLLVELIESVRRRAENERLRIAGIGVGVPGIVDAAAGRVGADVPHVPELQNEPLAAMLAQRFGLPTFVDNDVNALALAEWAFGIARGARSLVVLAAGTGFGSGVVLDGRLVRGAIGFAGEFGHVPVKFDGPPCWCGGRGCGALYASGRGIAEAARARVASQPGAMLLARAQGDITTITTPMVFSAAAEGDPLAAAVVEEACRALGAVLGVIVNGLNPEVVVITGGVAAAFLPLEKEILSSAAEYAFARALAGTRVRIVPGDKRLTVRGAAALVLYEMGALGGGRMPP